MFSWLTADCCGLGGAVDLVSCWMEEVAGKTASINSLGGLPLGRGFNGAGGSCAMEAVIAGTVSIEFSGGLPLGRGVSGVLGWVLSGTGASCIACPLSRISLPAACETGGEAARDSG